MPVYESGLACLHMFEHITIAEHAEVPKEGVLSLRSLSLRICVINMQMRLLKTNPGQTPVGDCVGRYLYAPWQNSFNIVKLILLTAWVILFCP